MQIYPSFTIAGWKEQRAVDGDPEIEFLGENWLDAITTLPPLDNTKEGGNHKPIWCGDRFFLCVCVLESCYRETEIPSPNCLILLPVTNPVCVWQSLVRFPGMRVIEQYLAVWG